jgi:hypothetical protein
MTPSLVQVDGFYPYPESLRRQVEALDFTTREWAGHEYQGVGILPEFGPWELVATACGLSAIRPALSFFRRGVPGDKPTVWIHADRAAASAAGLLYFDDVGGTAFWKHKALGWEELPPAEALGEQGDAVVDRLNLDGGNQRGWTMTGYVAAAPNRFIAYPTSRFHSRWPLELDRPRLIWVVFFDPA